MLIAACSYIMKAVNIKPIKANAIPFIKRITDEAPVNNTIQIESEFSLDLHFLILFFNETIVTVSIASIIIDGKIIKTINMYAKASNNKGKSLSFIINGLKLKEL